MIAIVCHVGRWLNAFCPKDGISSTISPRTLLTGVKMDYTRDCRIEVGAYAQVHDDIDPTNPTEKPRTTGAIALEHSGNLQGGYKFLSLNTGRVIDCRNFTILPVTSDVICRVHELAGKGPHIFEFGDRNNNVNDSDDDSVITGVISDTDSESESDSDYDPDDDDNDDDNDQWTLASQSDASDDRSGSENEDIDDGSVGIESLRDELQRAQNEFEDLISLNDDDDNMDEPHEDGDQNYDNDKNNNDPQIVEQAEKTTRSGHTVKLPTNYAPDFVNQ